MTIRISGLVIAGAALWACAGATGGGGVTVYDPASILPLYDAIVYVPNGPLPPMPEGATCMGCDTTELDSVTETRTDTDGLFVVPDMPVGTDVPLVIQIGKWRRQITIPNVPRCLNTEFPSSALTLPKNQAEGDIPLIAVTTGGADSLECLLLRMGVDPSEFTTASGGGRIHLYLSSCVQSDSLVPGE